MAKTLLGESYNNIAKGSYGLNAIKNTGVTSAIKQPVGKTAGTGAGVGGVLSSISGVAGGIGSLITGIINDGHIDTPADRFTERTGDFSFDQQEFDPMQKKSTGELIGNSFKTGLSGATTGLAAGPWGALAGGVIGQVGSIISGLNGNSKVDEWNRLQKEKIEKENMSRYSSAFSDFTFDQFQKNENLDKNVTLFNNGKSTVRYNSKFANAKIANGEVLWNTANNKKTVAKGKGDGSKDTIDAYVADKDIVFSNNPKNKVPGTNMTFADAARYYNDSESLSKLAQLQGATNDARGNIEGTRAKGKIQASVGLSDRERLAMSGKRKYNTRGTMIDSDIERFDPYNPYGGIDTDVLPSIGDYASLLQPNKRSAYKYQNPTTNKEAAQPRKTDRLPLANTDDGSWSNIPDSIRSRYEKEYDVVPYNEASKIGVKYQKFDSDKKPLLLQSKNSLSGKKYISVYPGRDGASETARLVGVSNDAPQPIVNYDTPTRSSYFGDVSLSTANANKQPTGKFKFASPNAAPTTGVQYNLAGMNNDEPATSIPSSVAETSMPDLRETYDRIGHTLKNLDVANPTMPTTDSIGNLMTKGNEPTQDMKQKTKFDINGLMGMFGKNFNPYELLQFAPAIYNAIEGNKAPEQVDYNQFYTPSTYKPTLHSYDPSNALRAAEDAERRAMYNSRQMGSESGINRAMNTALGSQLMRAKSGIYADAFNRNAGYKTAYDQAMMGQEESNNRLKSAAKEKAFMFNQAARENKKAYRGKAVSAIGDYGRTKTKDYTTSKSDNMKMKALYPFLNKYLPSELFS